MIDRYVYELVNYGIKNEMITSYDKICVVNKILDILKIDDIKTEDTCDCKEDSLEEILKNILDYAFENNLMEGNTTVHRDLFDTRIMSCLLPLPGQVIGTFNDLYKKSPKEATDYYYKLSQDSDYIRRYRVSKDLKWKSPSKFGELDITINLSKPEKDPKAIAAAKNAKQSGYPKCLLCKENEGYAGRMNHPARQNHRIIPITIADKKWFLQYSPYVYYNEHCICFNGEHVPMKIEKDTFKKLLDFVKQFPHYFVGSNADLPIVGGSILSHDHFQGGCYEFPMAKAEIETKVSFDEYLDIEAGIVKWPMSVIRLRGTDTNRLIELADKILVNWRSYTDEDAFVFASTKEDVNGKIIDVMHNTITPIARFKNGKFELDLVLRNNITTEEHPLGVYHPHEKLHHIKKENIGLIEVMGLAVLPSRLKKEMEDLKNAYINNADISNDDELKKHYEWFEQVKETRTDLNANNADEIIKEEIGKVFEEVLIDAGVYKYTEEGKENFLKFIKSI